MKQINGMNMFAKYLKRTSVLLLAALVMDLSFTYGKATLKEDTLSFVTNVDITATYSSDTLDIPLKLTGKGKTDIVAIKL